MCCCVKIALGMGRHPLGVPLRHEAQLEAIGPNDLNLALPDSSVFIFSIFEIIQKKLHWDLEGLIQEACMLAIHMGKPLTASPLCLYFPSVVSSTSYLRKAKRMMSVVPLALIYCVLNFRWVQYKTYVLIHDAENEILDSFLKERSL